MNSREALERATRNLRPGGCTVQDCHSCMFDRDALARLEADAQAITDVRTLDEWARKQRGHGHETMQIAGGLFLTRLLDAFSLSPTTDDFEGPTPDAARHAAAEWVRGQK